MRIIIRTLKGLYRGTRLGLMYVLNGADRINSLYTSFSSLSSSYVRNSMRVKKKISFVKVCYTLKMNKLALSILALFLWSPSVSAMHVQTVIDFYEGDALKKQIAYVAMHNAGEGIAWTNSVLEQKEGVKLFCAAPKLFFSGEEYYQIMKNHYDHAKSIGGYPEDDTYVGLVLLTAMILKYPCD